MPPNPPAEGPVSAIHGHGETILFIEDDKAMSDLMVGVFARFNYHPLVAPTVDDALHLWQGHRAIIQAVVSDCELGHERTGLSLLHEFAAAKPGLVLILASGSLTTARVQTLERTTTIKCLPKPFEFLKLLELLRTGLDTQKQ